MKKTLLLTVSALILIFTASCEEPQGNDPFLLVPGERAGLFFLNQEYEPVETLYKGYDFSEEIDDWQDVNIFWDGEIALGFGRMMEEGEDTRIDHTVGKIIGVFSSDFYTAEKISIGSSLQDLLDNYPKYRIDVDFIPEYDYAPLKYEQFYDIESLFAYIRQNGFDKIDPYGTKFSCLDAKGKDTGIGFYFWMENIDGNKISTVETKVTGIIIYAETWERESTVWY